ncbi:hypothetical protein [Bradyrhizobium sp. AZCC 1693]|uniref:hypothetical protein n=1 Tax=Bradyrhizobium sp. AZCC 1693 TaxID=3117029 RepID=UPI002FEFE7E2
MVVVMGAATVAAGAAVITAVVGTISAAGIMVAAIFMPDRPVHSPHTVHSLRLA